MAKNKLTDKIKEGVSVEEIENFASRHLTEVFAVVALVIGAVCSSWDFFTGPKLTIFVFTLCAALGIFFPLQIDRGLKQVYAYAYKQEKMTQIVFGAVNIVVAIFIPFVLFGIFGLLAGTAYNYFTHDAEAASGGKHRNHRHGVSGEEHD